MWKRLLTEYRTGNKHKHSWVFIVKILTYCCFGVIVLPPPQGSIKISIRSSEENKKTEEFNNAFVWRKENYTGSSNSEKKVLVTRLKVVFLQFHLKSNCKILLRKHKKRGKIKIFQFEIQEMIQ